jgi:hypothetical protein
MILTTLAALSAAPSQATSSQTSASAFVNTLMPQPAQLSTHEGRLVVTPSFTAIADHFRDARLDAAIERKLERIKSQTATLMATSLASDPASATLVVSVGAPERPFHRSTKTRPTRLRSLPPALTFAL